MEVWRAVGSSAGKATAFNCSLLWWMGGWGGEEALWLLLHNGALACQHAESETHTDVVRHTDVYLNPDMRLTTGSKLTDFVKKKRNKLYVF